MDFLLQIFCALSRVDPHAWPLSGVLSFAYQFDRHGWRECNVCKSKTLPPPERQPVFVPVSRGANYSDRVNFCQLKTINFSILIWCRSCWGTARQS